MNHGQVRGYIVLSAVDYLRRTAGELKSKQLLESLSPGGRQAISTATGASWCSCVHGAEVYRAIATLADGDQERAQSMLIQCGKETAREATNTFLRLIIRVLTPSLFAKKLPDLWTRDCSSGKIIADVREDRLQNRFVEIGGFDHIAPVAVGYVTFALETMGKKITKTDLRDWSLANPAPATFSFDVHWSV